MPESDSPQVPTACLHTTVLSPHLYLFTVFSWGAGKVEWTVNLALTILGRYMTLHIRDVSLHAGPPLLSRGDRRIEAA